MKPYGLEPEESTNNKFGAKKTVYNGVRYDSKKEAIFARRLDFMRLDHSPSDRVLNVERQVPYRFRLKGKEIFKYILDFKVQYADGTFKYFDVKGYTKGAAYNLFTIKKKCIEAQEGITIIEK